MKLKKNESENGNNPRLLPFLKKLLRLVSTCPIDVGNWNEQGTKYEIYKEKEFMKLISQVYGSNYATFSRQLNYYGFRRLESNREKQMHNNQEEEGIKRNGRVSHFFYHTSFLRDEPGRIFEIKRTPGPVRITTPSQKKKKTRTNNNNNNNNRRYSDDAHDGDEDEDYHENGDEDYYFLPTYTSKRKKQKRLHDENEIKAFPTGKKQQEQVIQDNKFQNLGNNNQKPNLKIEVSEKDYFNITPITTPTAVINSINPTINQELSNNNNNNENSQFFYSYDQQLPITSAPAPPLLLFRSLSNTSLNLSQNGTENLTWDDLDENMDSNSGLILESQSPLAINNNNFFGNSLDKQYTGRCSVLRLIT